MSVKDEVLNSIEIKFYQKSLVLCLISFIIIGGFGYSFYNSKNFLYLLFIIPPCCFDLFLIFRLLQINLNIKNYVLCKIYLDEPKRGKFKNLHYKVYVRLDDKVERVAYTRFIFAHNSTFFAYSTKYYNNRWVLAAFNPKKNVVLVIRQI